MGDTMKIYALAAGLALAAMSSAARAELIERTFDVTASSFFLIDGSSTPAPVDPVELNFTLIFDPSVVIGQTTAGLTINSFNLPFGSTYAYDGAGTLTLATYANPDECDNPASSYCVFISNAAGANPTANGFEQLTSSDGFWVSDTVTVTAGAITVVPEPSTWALLLVGLGGVGWLTRRRRNEGASVC
jgi:hypothetical protein